MKILVLGGTVFLSSAVVAELVLRGHEVTCLARGESEVPPKPAKLVRADRGEGRVAYDGLGGDWDAVMDVSWEPSYVRDALEVLGERAGHWTYVSSCSVYADNSGGELDESASVLSALSPGEVSSLANYGESKVACEEYCRAALESRLHICRPGLIGGPGDPSDRFGYWPARFARSHDDEVLVPQAETTLTSTIDVRDLAQWIVTAMESKIVGNFNALGAQHTLAEVLSLCQSAAGHRGEMIPIDEDWLLEHDVAPWSGEGSLPLWIPRSMGYDVFAQRTSDRALARGLSLRPLEELISATLEFERHAGIDRHRRAGLSPEREKWLLEKWSVNRAAT